MQKKNRLKLLSMLVSGRDIQTQEELADLMKQHGALVSPSVLRADIRELGIQKQMTETGHYAYRLPHNGIVNAKDYINSANLSSMIADVRTAANLVIVKTFNAGASAVASALDAAEDPEIIGTVAGFDTVMVATKDTETALRIADKIRSVVY
ncbi:MAG: hypothetical protein J6S14_15445 [Clostridia bacterium]|nr:hypothetical protein [Clostridia bacterium]